ncbi:MAG TPA: bifunctional serine/threonine-protein kinase/formylglycine-generating enzyme family protein, partial [Blastocatellia bacterium]|nr:bifunctional serine/threonine-protein kinase/formylglycine-generating enzyme family protein [Blastocatellia bacterium]
ARLLAGLRHAALPVVSDHFKEGDGQFLVMQYIPGDDLATMLERNGSPFPVEDVLKWADQLLDALDYLHSHEPPVIHRDIKPQNLKLTKRGEVILLDFGLAKGAPQVLSQVSKGGSILGYTPHYAPLEQMQGVGTGPRSDLYSLAATLYVLLTGVTPPDALTRASAVLSGQPDPLRAANECNPAVPPRVAEVLRWAMDLNRDLRPASADDMRRLLREAGAQGAEADTVVMGARPQTAGESLPAATIPQAAANGNATKATGSQTEPVQTGSVKTPQKTRALWVGIGGLLVLALGFTVAASLGLFSGQMRLEPEKAADAMSPVPKALASGSDFEHAQIPPVTTFNFETFMVDAAGKVTKRAQSKAEGFAEDLGDGVTMEMVFVPGGNFAMGSPETEVERRKEEGPQHQVEVPSFFMGKYEVTQAQWRAVATLPKVKLDLNPNPSELQGDNLPVERVSWEEASEFCERLAKKTGRAYALPSEAQWEYACRAGTTTPFHFGATLTPQIANYDERSPYASAPEGAFRSETMPVGSFRAANAFGLYDMHGNVWEWCRDVWHENYNGAPADASAWLTGGDQQERVLRGGSWINAAKNCRSAVRNSDLPTAKYPNTGFRVVLTTKRMLR